MVLRSKMTKATTSLTFLTAMLALSGCYTSLRATGASAGGAAGSSVDANGLGGVGGLPLGGQGGGVGAGGAGGSSGDATSDGSSATGGTTYTPDAPLFNDASDVPTALTNGSLCTTDDQCSNNACVDGHCCDSKCAGNCESCVTGTCSFTSTPRKACNGSGKCAGTCDKANTQACTYPDSSTVCRAQSCSGVQRTNKSVCDGLGNCPTQTKTTCDSNQCLADGSDCSGTCSATSCGAGNYCAGSTCATLKNQGDSCSDKVECSTGNCVDGYCCESACTGTCTSCAVTHGKCTNTTSPRTGKSCSGTAPCNASCTGSSPDCVPASASTPCGSATCLTSTQLQLAGTCNSQGTCSQNTQTCTACVQNACADCTPSTSQCSGGVPQTCDSSGHWVSGTCGTGKVCSGTATNCVCSGSTPKDCGDGICRLSSACCGNDCGSGNMCTNHQCVCDNSNNSCGSGTSCIACRPDTHCYQGDCVCDGTLLSCGGCGIWTFETSGQTEGWISTDSSYPVTLRQQTRNGKGVLAFDLSQGTQPTIQVDLCPTAGSSTNIGALYLRGTIYFVDGAGSPSFTGSEWIAVVTSLNGMGIASFSPVGGGVPIVFGPISLSDSYNGSTVSSIGLAFVITPTGWFGTVFIDEIKITNN